MSAVIKEVKKRLEHSRLHEQFLLETLETLKEKEDVFNNEVAFCKIDNKLVPCVVVGVDLPNFREILEGQGEVLVRVQTKRGPCSVALDDVVPYNDKSKILFGK